MSPKIVNLNLGQKSKLAIEDFVNWEKGFDTNSNYSPATGFLRKMHGKKWEIKYNYGL